MLLELLSTIKYMVNVSSTTPKKINGKSLMRCEFLVLAFPYAPLRITICLLLVVVLIKRRSLTQSSVTIFPVMFGKRFPHSFVIRLNGSLLIWA